MSFVGIIGEGNQIDDDYAVTRVEVFNMLK